MDTQSLKDKLMFMSVGYICSGSLIAILASIQFYASFFSQEQTFFAALVAVFWVLFSAVSILLIRYLVPKYGAKAIYEHDILVLMIVRESDLSEKILKPDLTTATLIIASALY